VLPVLQIVSLEGREAGQVFRGDEMTQQALRIVVLLIFAVLVSLATTVIILVKGFGLPVKNWWWFVCAGFVGHIIILIIQGVAQ
jgi:hypothetical protein